MGCVRNFLFKVYYFACQLGIALADHARSNFGGFAVADRGEVQNYIFYKTCNDVMRANRCRRYAA